MIKEIIDHFHPKNPPFDNLGSLFIDVQLIYVKHLRLNTILE